MPRQRPVRTVPPLQEAVPASMPPIDDPVYRALLAAESTAYMAWLSYAPTQQREAKAELSALRRTYEEKRAERGAYHPPDPAELIARPGTLPWQ
jgi:hypothetical protein